MPDDEKKIAIARAELNGLVDGIAAAHKREMERISMNVYEELLDDTAGDYRLNIGRRGDVFGVSLYYSQTVRSKDGLKASEVCAAVKALSDELSANAKAVSGLFCNLLLEGFFLQLEGRKAYRLQVYPAGSTCTFECVPEDFDRPAR